MLYRNLVAFILLYFLSCTQSTALTLFDSPENTESVNDTWVEDFLNANYDVICKMQPNAYDCSPRKNLTSVARYYFDIKMQTCLSFDYYDCPLSFNNFFSLYECHEHCKAPGPSSIPPQNPAIYCRLQPDFGACDHYHPQYYYDITTRQCEGFSYSGCGGNENRFTTRKKCVSKCSPILGAMD